MTFRENTVVELNNDLELIGGGILRDGQRGMVLRTMPQAPDADPGSALVLVALAPRIGLPDFFRVWVDARRLKVPSP